MISRNRAHTDAAVLLLDAGSDPHLRSENGASPLHYAASSGDHELCRILALVPFSDLFLEDNDG